MKNGMLTIFRKELARFFGDKRTALGTILLPGILIFAVYTFMGSALSDQFSVDEDFVPTIQAINLPDSVAALAGQAGLDIQAAEGTDQSKALIQEQELDLLAVFPEGFDNHVAHPPRRWSCTTIPPVWIPPPPMKCCTPCWMGTNPLYPTSSTSTLDQAPMTWPLTRTPPAPSCLP